MVAATADFRFTAVGRGDALRGVPARQLSRWTGTVQCFVGTICDAQIGRQVGDNAGNTQGGGVSGDHP